MKYWKMIRTIFNLDMAAVFDLAKTRIGNKRDQVEEALREKIDKFETKVQSKQAHR